MMMQGNCVLVTGGAGFIGRNVAAELLARGARVRVLDSLVPQVHQGADKVALPSDVEFIRGDVRDADAVRRALAGVDGVVHLAAEVGVGQSMYAIERYTDANDTGTAVLLEQMIGGSVSRIVTASSMSIYGEGLYADVAGSLHDEVTRAPLDLQWRKWDPRGSDGTPLRPLPTPETKRPMLASVYAIGKYVQERLTLTVAQPYGIEALALRLWNVFGPGQALSNPYTGVLAIFASRIANGQPPMVFEDGQQLRDFVHVDDVSRAFVDALEVDGVSGQVLNIASGQIRTVNSVADDLAAAMGSAITAEVTQEGRVGDVRHCIADITRARQALGFEPQEDFRARLVDLAEWVGGQSASDHVARATNELKVRGLVI